LSALGTAYGAPTSAEDLAAYVYALLANQSYTQRFWNELETPGPRIPITRDAALFKRAVELGRHLIFLHTYGERFAPAGVTEIPQGKARIKKGVPTDSAHYPEQFSYNEAEQEIFVGLGIFGPVSKSIWEFEVSGLKVVQSWLGYRMKIRAGKKSSPLDDIRPESWTPKMTDEFLELLWVLEHTLNLEPQLRGLLDEIVASPCFKANELPQPTDAERRPPRSRDPNKADLFDDLADADEDDDED
jgi:hypothetical protein